MIPTAWRVTTDPIRAGRRDRPAINAAPDLAAWFASFDGARREPPGDAPSGESDLADAPGFFITLEPPPAARATVEAFDLLSRLQLISTTLPANCSTSVRSEEPLDDPRFLGFWTVVACDHQGTYAQAFLTPKASRAFLIHIEFVVVSEADAEVVDEFMRTLELTPPAGLLAPVHALPAPPPIGVEFVRVADDTGRITLELPAAWQVATHPLSGAPTISAAPDLEAWHASFAGLRSRHTPPYEVPDPATSRVTEARGIFITLPPLGEERLLGIRDLLAFEAGLARPANCSGPFAPEFIHDTLGGFTSVAECDHGGEFDVHVLTRRDLPHFVIWAEALWFPPDDRALYISILDSLRVRSLAEAAKPLVAEIVALATSEVHAIVGDREAAADAVADLVVGADQGERS